MCIALSFCYVRLPCHLTSCCNPGVFLLFCFFHAVLFVPKDASFLTVGNSSYFPQIPLHSFQAESCFKDSWVFWITLWFVTSLGSRIHKLSFSSPSNIPDMSVIPLWRGFIGWHQRVYTYQHNPTPLSGKVLMPCLFLRCTPNWLFRSSMDFAIWDD